MGERATTAATRPQAPRRPPSGTMGWACAGLAAVRRARLHSSRLGTQSGGCGRIARLRRGGPRGEGRTEAGSRPDVSAEQGPELRGGDERRFSVGAQPSLSVVGRGRVGPRWGA